MNEVKIVILEGDDESTILLREVLKEVDYQDVTKIESSKELSDLVTKSQIDFAILNFKVLDKIGKNEVLEKLKIAEIPSICLFEKNGIGDSAVNKNTEPVAILGNRLSSETLKRSIERMLFFNKRQEYLQLKEQFLLEDHIFVKIGSQLEKVKTQNILYITSDGNYSMVQTEDRKYAVKVSLKKMLEELPASSFARVHRSCLVQLSKISKINIAENQVFIGEKCFPLGRYYKSDVLARLKKIG